ncbi:hypothetical protein LP414_01835 [Polaromonas sp. P1(28)-13]|nr:hypothetical protein LP414_01835 [Polaromonas sp. P1(28)-13]
MLNSRHSTWLLTNSILAACVYFGMVANVYLVGSAVSVFVWVMLISYGFVLLSNKKKVFTRQVPFVVEALYDIALCMAMVAAGWHVTAIAYGMSFLTLEMVISHGRVEAKESDL